MALKAITSFLLRHAGALGLLCTFMAGSSLAQVGNQSQATEQKGPAVSPGDVEIKFSRAYVFVDKTGLGHQHAVQASLKSGTLKLGAESAAGELVFDMKSFDADTDLARKYIGLEGSTDDSTRKAVNENMLGSAVLDVAKYPTASFKVASAQPTGKTSRRGLPTFRLLGDFELHGTKRPIDVLVEAERINGWLHIRGNFAIKQTDFGITPFSKAFGAIGVSDELRIFGDLFVAPTDKVAWAEIPQRQ